MSLSKHPFYRLFSLSLPPDAGFKGRTRVHGKSILRDPICEGLRAQIKTGVLTNSPLEAEIDDLLHGCSCVDQLNQALDGDMERREVPYVSMIEVKYRESNHLLPPPSSASVATPSPASTTYTSSSNYSRSLDSS